MFKFGFGFRVYSFLFRSLSDIKYFIVALTVISMGFCGIFGSLPRYMLPIKWDAADGVLVIEVDPETTITTNNNAAASSFKNHPLNNCIISAVAAKSTGKNRDNIAIIGSNSDQSNGRVVESSPPVMALGDANHTEIDERSEERV